MGKPAHQVRRENFAAKVARAGGPKAFAERYDENIDYVRQILKGKDGGGRNIGDRAARRIEKMLGEPMYSLDADRSAPKDAEQRTGGDVIALQIAVESILSALVSRLPGSASAFLADLAEAAKEREFPTDAGELLTLVGIAKSAQEAEEESALPRRLRDSGGRKRPGT